MREIQDHLGKNMKILFIGYNPSLISSKTGHHYANPNNRFWKILEESGLTPRRYSPYEDFKLLLEYGYGFTNIVSRPTKSAEEITKEEYQVGRENLRRKIEEYKPKIACFVGKGVYLEYSEKKTAPWGIQGEGIVKGVIDFVAPSSSGLVRMKFEEIIYIYKKLKELSDQLND